MSKSTIDSLIASMNSATTAHRDETERERLAHHAVCDDILTSIRHHFPNADPNKIAEVLILILASITRASVTGARERFDASIRISAMLVDQIMRDTHK